MRIRTAIVIGISLLSNCKEQQFAIPLSLYAEDHEAKPIANASVYVNGNRLGFTDSKGLLQATMEAPLGAKLMLQVRKDDSPAFYYGPFQQTIVLSEVGLTKQSVKAKLYSVPKMLKDEQTAKATEKTAAEPVALETPSLSTGAEATPPSAVQADVSPPVEEVIESTPIVSPGSPEGSLLTVHTYSSSKAIGGVEIRWGINSEHILRPGCVTNERGRCSFRLPASYLAENAEQPILMLRKANYQTVFDSSKIKESPNLLFELKHGQALDVELFSRAYGVEFGVQGAAVFINGTQMGETNPFGFFTYLIESFEPKPINLVVNASQYSPEVSDIDLPAVRSGLIRRLVKPKALLPPKLSFVAPNVRVNDLAASKADIDLLNEHVLKALEKTVSDDLNLTGQASNQQTPVMSIVPSIYLDKTALMELSLLNHKGEHIAGALQAIDRSNLKSDLPAFTATTAHSLAEQIPYQATVIGVAKDDVSVNLGKKHTPFLKVGEGLIVYSSRYTDDSFAGLKQTATLKVKEVWNDMSLCEVVDNSGTDIKVGDTAVLHDPFVKKTAKKFVTIKVSDLNGVGIGGVRLYLNGMWSETSGVNGNLAINVEEGLTPISLVALHPDFLPFLRSDLRVESLNTLSIQMQRRQEVFRLESDPPGAAVSINAKDRGKTPLDINLQEETLPLNIAVIGPNGHKTFEKVIEKADVSKVVGTVQKFVLPIDSRSTARRFVTEKKFQDAINELEKIAPTDPDYLSAMHDLGEIYLQKLNDPARAAAVFTKITSDPLAANFTDKRFLSAFINEAIATFLLAERTGPEEAMKSAPLYRKTAAILGRVQPLVNLIPAERRVEATHEIDYYLALAKHKMWVQTKDMTILDDVKKSWEVYLKNSETHEGTTFASYIENAKTYLKQAETSGLTTPEQKITK